MKKVIEYLPKIFLFKDCIASVLFLMYPSI